MDHKKKVYRAISLISLLVMAGAILSLILTFYLYRKASTEYLQLAQTARTAAVEAPSSLADETGATPSPAPAEESVEEAPQATEAPPAVPIPINFPYLESVNEDIIAWIEVEGTTVDYPILYDNSATLFYLNHNYAKAYTPCGSIFMLSENKADFSDFNTVVYGHNLIDGGMFGVLHDLENPDFFRENKTILVYTPDRVLQYRIFAAYRTDNLNQLQNFSYETPEERQAYIDRIYTHDLRAIFDPDVTVTPDDRILTLSTCIANPVYRYLVQGVLVSEQPGILSAAMVPDVAVG